MFVCVCVCGCFAAGTPLQLTVIGERVLLLLCVCVCVCRVELWPLRGDSEIASSAREGRENTISQSRVDSCLNLLMIQCRPTSRGHLISIVRYSLPVLSSSIIDIKQTTIPPNPSHVHCSRSRGRTRIYRGPTKCWFLTRHYVTVTARDGA